jgi:hypothetical protein
MKEFTFDVKDMDPNICTVVIACESKAELIKLIDDVGIDEIISYPDDYAATTEWNDQIHQPDFRIMGDIVEVEPPTMSSIDIPKDSDTLGCNKYHAKADDSATGES